MSGYRTIVADPPWRYRTVGITSTTRVDGPYAPEAERNYTTMTLPEIAALPIRGMTDADAHLYLWTTNPMLPVALPVVPSS